MSYGFAVYSASGAARVFEGSWLFKYHSTHTITAPAGGSTTKNISGFNPDSWAVQAVSVTSSSGEEYATVFRVSFHQGYIRVYGSFTGDLTVTVNVLKG